MELVGSVLIGLLLIQGTSQRSDSFEEAFKQSCLETDVKYLLQFCKSILTKTNGLEEPKEGPETNDRQSTRQSLPVSSNTLAYFTLDFLNYFGIKQASIVLHESDTKDLNLAGIMAILTSMNIATKLVIVSKTKPLDAPIDRDGVISTATATIFLSSFVKLEKFATQNRLLKNCFCNGLSYWLVFDGMLFANRMDLTLTSQVYSWNYIKDTEISISEMYRPSKQMSPIINIVGHFNSKQVLTMTSIQIWKRRQNLRGVVLKITGNLDKGYFYAEETNRGTVLSGLYPAIWQYFEKQSNFTTKYVPNLDGQYGGLQENGSFNGMIGMLERGEIDAATDGFAILGSRVKVADPMVPLGLFVSEIYYKSTTSSSSQFQWWTYTKPYARTTWGAIVCTILVCYVFFVTTAKYGQVTSEDYDFHSIRLSTVIMIHGSFNQGIPKEPKRSSTRIVFFTIYMIMIIIWSSYYAVLTSYLTAKVEVLPFTSLEDLLHRTNYRIASISGGFYEGVFKNGQGVLREIYDTIFYTKDSYEELFQEMEDDDNVAVFGYAKKLEDQARQSCHYRRFKAWRKETPFTFFLAKNSPYRDLLNHHLQKLQETGQMKRIRDIWIPFVPGAICASLESEALGIEVVISSVTLLGIAVTLSLLISLLEKALKTFVL